MVIVAPTDPHRDAAVEQIVQLILDLQHCALAAGHEQPLLIALDQENGSLNAFSEDAITQFPHAMGIAACQSTTIAGEIASAVAKELSCLGVNWILGPVLDVLSGVRPQSIGVRAFGDDPTEVGMYGKAIIASYNNQNLACCGKHFPSYGDVDFSQTSQYSKPTISQPAGQLQQGSLLPFAAAIESGVDAMFVGGCAMTGFGEAIPHACLSPKIVTELLRKKMGFSGVALGDCLLLESVYQNTEAEIGNRAIAAVRAGCDMFMVCQSFTCQVRALDRLKAAVLEDHLPRSLITNALERVNRLKSKCTNWQKALYPSGLSALQDLKQSHQSLSLKAYRAAISVVRDYRSVIPRIASLLSTGDEILLLTPLLDLFPSTATKLGSSPSLHESGSRAQGQFLGEEVFQHFGSLLARAQGSRVLHASYSSNGIRPQQEELINRSAAVIVMTADAARNTYQYGVAKYVNMLCKFGARQSTLDNDAAQAKPYIVVAVSSPWDFLSDPDIASYVCTYDFSSRALETLAELLCGTLIARGVPPLGPSRRKKRGRGDSATGAETH